jgi:hypothetical protein
MSSVKELKAALIGELHKQITTGTVIEVEKDGEVTALTVSPAPALLSVAAKVVKDFQDEAKVSKPQDEIVAQANEMSDLLKRYGNRAVQAKQPSA